MFRQSPKKIIGISIILIVIITLSFINIKNRNEILQTEAEKETLFAIYIDGEKASQLPSKKEGYVFDEEKSFCSNNVNINWSYLLWTANIDFANYKIENKEKTFCNLYFKKEEYKFEYTGSEQEFNVPKDGYYQIELWGASANNTEKRNGAGAYTSGIINLEKEEIMYIYVGGMKGYNGGGIQKPTESHMANEGCGGGATDIRLKNGLWNNSVGLSSRIMVAAGGGSLSHGGDGGPGGTLRGMDGIPTTDPSYTGANSCGYGGTQIAGGAKGYHNFSSSTTLPTAGSFGIGGKGENYYGGSGGGGYYGGGGAGINLGGKAAGGGGSSYMSGYPGCIAIQSETNQVPKVQVYSKIEDSYHYSGKIFTEGIMIAGNAEMPNYNNNQEKMIGNRGNGYARVTYLGR